jgi:hypothetical protein
LHQLRVSRDIALRRIIHERHWVIGIKLTTLDGLLNTSDDCALLIPLALSRKNQVISILGVPTQRIWDLVHRSRAWTVEELSSSLRNLSMPPVVLSFHSIQG